MALADATTLDQVVSAIAEVLSVRAEGARPLLDTIGDRLSAGRVLLLLDNFEQILDARAVVADLLGPYTSSWVNWSTICPLL